MTVKYIVDSNFFIQAHRDTYPLDVAVSFWEKVKLLANSGVIISIDKVKNEIYGQKDDLEKWCRINLPQDFFKSTSTVIEEYVTVSEWATSRQNHYLQKALNEFLSVDEADAFLIAYTLADKKNRCIVTQETSNPDQKNRIKIPDCCCCDSINVQYLNIMDMFRALKESF